jgi:hypothetical protein
MVPVIPVKSMIMLLSVESFPLRMASRRVPLPESAVEVTLKVIAVTGEADNKRAKDREEYFKEEKSSWEEEKFLCSFRSDK